jgi:hypothetical protein
VCATPPGCQGSSNSACIGDAASSCCSGLCCTGSGCQNSGPEPGTCAASGAGQQCHRDADCSSFRDCVGFVCQ